MARFFTGLFGGSKQTQPPATSMRINTSLQGVAIPIVLGGSVRLAANLIDYYGFNSQQQSGSGGGKGGVTGGGSKGQGGGQYAYYVTFAAGICEGPIGGVGAMWVNGTVIGLTSGAFTTTILPDGSPVAYEVFNGTYDQAPWGYTDALVRSGAIAVTHDQSFRGLAYAAFENYPLGGSTSMPNITFEVASSNLGALPGQPDGFADVAWTNFLTNPYWGAGFPAFRMGRLQRWRNYTVATGIAVSPAISSPVQASSFLNDLLTVTNSAACWQDGLLTVVPYGDTPVTAGQITAVTETHQVPANTSYPELTVGNAGTFAGDLGVTYQNGVPLAAVQSPVWPLAQGTYWVTGGAYYFSPSDANQVVLTSYNWAASASFMPDTTPVFDFTLDHFLPLQGTIGSGLAAPNAPLVVVRKPRDQLYNVVKVEYLDRANSYNPVLITAKDEAMITQFGRERPSDVRQLHMLCLASAAQKSAQLQLIRQQVARTFQWTCGRHFKLILELMSLATVTDPTQGLFRQAVRVIEIQENSDFSLTVTAEEYLGTVSTPEYGHQATSGYVINYNVAPGGINPPIIFEPTDELGGGLVVQGAISGANPALWGGCYVWASYDGENYTRVGQQFGAARMGVLAQTLPAVPANPTGQTIDQVNILAVDLTESAGALGAATQRDALALNTRCYVGGEIVAFAGAQLVSAHRYSLSYLVRGAYGTESAIATHPPGTPFARLDGSIFSVPFDQSRIGSVIYLKFQSFNIWEGGLQSLGDIPAYPYTITGSALASPLPNVQNLRTVYDVNTGFQTLVWDDITDFRAFKYEIRVGASPAAAMTLGQVAHPPFRVPGDGTYWVSAVSQPVAGLTVYSETWADVAISGSIITNNVIKTIDLQALGWPGTFTGGAGVDNSLNAIRTGGGNILTDANILATADIINYGGGSVGIYYPSNVAFIDVGYVANCSVAIKYQPTGVPIGQNVLTTGDFLSVPDVLGSASTRFIEVEPRINFGTTPGGDLYSLGDLYAYPDLYTIGSVNWNGWQAFSPGTYQARFLDFSMLLNTLDPNTIAYDLAFAITVTIPARIDQLSVGTVSSGALAVTFKPNGAATAAPFNGGAGAGNTPVIQGTIRTAQAGDALVIASLSLAGCTVEVLNGGAPVVRTVDLTIQGY